MVKGQIEWAPGLAVMTLLSFLLHPRGTVYRDVSRLSRHGRLQVPSVDCLQTSEHMPLPPLRGPKSYPASAFNLCIPKWTDIRL